MRGARQRRSDSRPGTNGRIEIVRNSLGGFIGAGVSLGERSRNILIKDNDFHDLRQVDSNRVVFESNFVVRSKNYCMQVGGDGRGDDGTIRGLEIRNNIVWDCGFGGILFSAPGRDWTLEGNIIQSLEEGLAAGAFGTQRHNLIRHGERGGTDFGGAPKFVNPARADYRLRGDGTGVEAAGVGAH